MNVTFGGKKVSLIGTELLPGDTLPEFSLTTPHLENFTKEDMKFPCMILTFPSVDTGPCSLELLTFNDRLEGTNYTVYGVSADLPFALERWVKVNAGDYIQMLSDHRTLSFAEGTGTLVGELKLLARAIFIIDRNGQCVYSEIMPEIGSEPDYDMVMTEAERIFTQA